MADNDLSIIVTDQNGQTTTIPALEGWSVMEIIRDAGLHLKAECGGALACATCHVYVDPAWVDKLPSPHDDERDLIIDHALRPQATSRLACQILMTPALDHLAVTLGPWPETENKATAR
jgi:2Fe-2S ferredoxin